MCGSSIDWEDKGKKCGGPLNCDPRRSALRWLCLFPYSSPPQEAFSAPPRCVLPPSPADTPSCVYT